MKEQTPPLSLILESARQKTFAAINKVQQETSVPAFLFEGIILDVLAQIRDQKNSELTQDLERMNAGLKSYYEAKINELRQPTENNE